MRADRENQSDIFPWNQPLLLTSIKSFYNEPLSFYGSEEEAFYYCRCFMQSWDERKSGGKEVLSLN
jgi:hypothetical protein